jgi:hypothetical protein
LKSNKNSQNADLTRAINSELRDEKFDVMTPDSKRLKLH